MAKREDLQLPKEFMGLLERYSRQERVAALERARQLLIEHQEFNAATTMEDLQHYYRYRWEFTG